MKEIAKNNSHKGILLNSLNGIHTEMTLNNKKPYIKIIFMSITFNYLERLVSVFVSQHFVPK